MNFVLNQAATVVKTFKFAVFTSTMTVSTAFPSLKDDTHIFRGQQLMLFEECREQKHLTLLDARETSSSIDVETFTWSLSSVDDPAAL